MTTDGNPERGQRTADPVPEEPLAPQPTVAAASTPASPRGAKRTFASLSNRNYRLWYIGQASSLGTWMQTTAQAFLIFQLTQSPVYLGYIGFATGIPMWMFTLFGGVASDRLKRRSMLLATQTTMMLLAFILAALTFSGLVQPWHIILLAFGVGTANAFDAPARQAFVPELVGPDNLANAIALNSTMVNLATATGPAIAGVAYALVGPGWCFTINGVSFIAVIGALLLMRLRPLPPRKRTGTAVQDFVEGLRYTLSHRTIRVLISIVAVATTFGASFTTLLPAWAVNILGGDATTNGFLQSARGVGSLIGALIIASLGHIKFKGKLLTVGTLLFPGLLLLWSVMRWLPLSLLVLMGVGLGMMWLLNMANVMVQTLVPDHLRGRVMSVFTLSFFGMMPVGALLAGAEAEVIGEPATVALGAAITLAFAFWLILRVPKLRALE